MSRMERIRRICSIRLISTPLLRSLHGRAASTATARPVSTDPD